MAKRLFGDRPLNKLFMKYSKLFTKTIKNAPKDEVSKNAKFLIRGGFVSKEMAGVYTYLPLGIRVINKISDIIREEMNAADGQEIMMTALQEKDIWEKTGRWSDKVVDNWFKTSLKNGGELGLGFTHEEPLTRLMKNYINSYKDLPIYVYQIQTKFRNEARAKSGLLRGREFLMKDLYSFSKDKEEHEIFYEKMKEVYMKVFERFGMADKTYITISSGGSFSKYSHEFQTLCEAGEDEIYIIDEDKKMAINKNDFNEEIVADFNLKVREKDLTAKKSIEVGDIYALGYKYSEALNLSYKDKTGKDNLVFMGCYGMSPSRLMGSIVEMNHDDKGIIWPENVAPFKVNLISLKENKEAESIYNDLQNAGIEVLYDDREEVSAGEKFADADLIGCPYRAVVSAKTLKENSVELKKRGGDEVKLIKISKLTDAIAKR